MVDKQDKDEPMRVPHDNDVISATYNGPNTDPTFPPYMAPRDDKLLPTLTGPRADRELPIRLEPESE